MLNNGVRSLHTCCLRFPYAAEGPLLRSISYRRIRRRLLFATFCSAVATANKERKPKVIVISGPTGAGKSRLAMELAKRLNGEIISADSVQVYQGLDIGSAKPSARDRKEVSHHLLDILRPSEEYSVGRFFEDARQATRYILDNGRVPIVSGGTGLYLRWFMYGKPNVPKASPDIAAEVCFELAELQRNEDWDAAVQLVVKAGDPRAQHLATNDWYRLRRSYEIIKASGSPPSAFQVPYDTFRQECGSGAASSFQDADNSVDPHVESSEEIRSKELDYDFICFFLSSPRLNLYRSIDFRCEDMISGSDGILSEASWLLNSGLLPNSNSATRAIGYRQVHPGHLHIISFFIFEYCGLRLSISAAYFGLSFGFRRFLSNRKVTNVASLLSLFKGHSFRHGRRDLRVWGPSPLESFSSFLLGMLVFLVLWRIKIPRKVRFFIWQILHGRANTMDQLVRKLSLFVGPFYCTLCQKTKKDLDHILWRCEFCLGLVLPNIWYLVWSSKGH